MIGARGLFLSFEGGEGAGKTTLIEGIAAALRSQGLSVLKTREPGGTDLGEKIRSLLLEKTVAPLSPYAELSLFLASRAQHIAEVIAPALEQKRVVLCDRFNDSSIAYQGAARGLGMEAVAGMCTFICQGLEPDLTFYLDIAPEKGLERALKERVSDRIEAEQLSFHEKIRAAYLLLRQRHPHRMQLLDATLPASAVLEEALAHIHHRLKG